MLNRLLLLDFKQEKDLDTTATELCLGTDYLQQCCISIVSNENKAEALI